MSKEGESQSKWTPKNILYIGIVLLILYNLYSGLVVKKIGIPGIAEIEFGEKPSFDDRIQDLSAQQLRQKQAELEKKLREMEEQLRTQGSSQTSSDRYINVSGIWQNSEGLNYMMQQNGNFVVLQEIHPLYGVTAAGQGTLYDQALEVSYMTVIGTSGNASLNLSSDGRSMTGTFTDFSTGMVVPINLYR